MVILLNVLPRILVDIIFICVNDELINVVNYHNEPK